MKSRLYSVSCARCRFRFDWPAEHPIPCPECKCRMGIYKGGVVTLAPKGWKPFDLENGAPMPNGARTDRPRFAGAPFPDEVKESLLRRFFRRH
jgi:hypothetical protein